jgi:hypothetical protein
MFLKRQREARRSIPFQPPRRVQGDAISVKNERKMGEIKGKRDKVRIGKAARTPRRHLKNKEHDSYLDVANI